jgi:hypothetical protein
MGSRTVADMNMSVEINDQGYFVKWSRLRAAARYEVTAAVTPLRPSDRWETVTATLATASAGQWSAQVSGPAIVSSVPGGALLTAADFDVRFRMDVLAYDRQGNLIGRGATVTPCPKAALVAVRGTSQNPESEFGNPDGFAAGLGNVSRALWDDLRQRSGLSFSDFPAIASDAMAEPNMHDLATSVWPPPRNPARWVRWLGEGLGKVFGYSLGYPESVSNATGHLENRLSRARRECPNTVLVLSGFSQGAQVVGDVMQRPSQARLYDQVALFADPRQRSTDTAVQYPETTRGKHDKDGLMSWVGGIRVRPKFAAPERLSSWCWVGDMVCVASRKNIIDRHFHTDNDFPEGDRRYDPYLCYIKWASWHTMNGLTTRGELSGSPGTRPACQPVT